MDWKKILRKLRNYSIVLICIGAMCFSLNLYLIESRNTVPYNEYPEGSVLVARNTYVYPYKTIVVIYKNGTVKKSKIVDELTDKGLPKEHYQKINDLSWEQIDTLKSLIEDCENHRTATLDILDYGLLIKTRSESTLESCTNFEQVYVDRLNEFIESIGE